jgi:hypothetical protein
MHGPGVGGVIQFNDNVNVEFEEYPWTKIQYVTAFTEVHEYDADVPAQPGPASSFPPIHVNKEQVPENTDILLSQAVAQSDAVMI